MLRERECVCEEETEEGEGGRVLLRGVVHSISSQEFSMYFGVRFDKYKEYQYILEFVSTLLCQATHQPSHDV